MNRRVIFIVAVLLGLRLCSSAGQAKEPIPKTSASVFADIHNITPAEMIREWQEALERIALTEKAPIVFRIEGLDSLPPNTTYSRPCGVEAMQTLAEATKHDWRQVEGVQVFSGFHPTPDRRRADLALILDWMTRLQPQERRALLEGRFRFDHATVAVQEAIRRMYEWEPATMADLYFAMLDKRDAIYLQLSYTSAIEYKVPGFDFNFRRYLDESILSKEFKPPADPFPAASEALPIVPLQPSMGGALDFGSGAVLPLKEILQKAHTAFPAQLELPALPPEEYYFISGSYNAQSFKGALLALSEMEKAAAATSRKGMLQPDSTVLSEKSQAFLRELLQNEWKGLDQRRAWIAIEDHEPDEPEWALEAQYKNAYDLTNRDFLEGRSMTLEDLRREYSVLARSYFSMGSYKEGAEARELRLSFKPSLRLMVRAEGKHVGTTTLATVDEKTVTSWGPNQIALMFDTEPLGIKPGEQEAASLPRAEEELDTKIGLAQPNVKVGEAAPAFAMTDAFGKTFDLQSYRGKKSVLLTFFPKCFTGGCANHLSSLRDRQAEFDKNDIQIVAVSVDAAEGQRGQREFAKQWQLSFPLIPDTGRVLSKLYGAVQNADERAARMTIFIDAAGIVRFIDTNVQVKNHGAETLAKLRELGFAK